MLHGKEHRMIKKSPILFLLAIFLLSACGLARPTPTPTATPLPTSTPTSTSTPTPSPTPTPGPSYPPSLSPEDQDFLKAHADDPNVHWEYDAASGNTHVFINSDFDITNPALVEQIKAQCRDGDCTVISNSKRTIWLTGKFSGDTEIIIAQDGGVELVTSMVTVNHSNELVPVKFRLILDKRNKLTNILWEQAGIEGDRVTIEQLLRIFPAGQSFQVLFASAYLPDNPFVKRYLANYPKEYYDKVRAWFEDGLSPRNVPDELICVAFG
jgi:hypothetical protein